jgi:hypothetical protein
VWFRRESFPEKGTFSPAITTNKYTIGNKEGRIYNFYIMKKPIEGNREPNEKLYLKFNSFWSMWSLQKHSPASSFKFRFKITIEKSGNEFLAARCRYLKFLPKFLYNSLTGSRCNSLVITNDNVAADNQDNPNQVSSDPNCPTPHDENKKYSPANAAEYLGTLLATGRNNWYNKFKCSDPQIPAIPQKARGVYSLSTTWNPKYNSTDYIQCVSFVFMSYNMAGNPIKKMEGTTNGKNFVDDKYTGPNGQFTKYENGKSSTLPQKGDILVWTDGDWGHAGIVANIQEWNNTIQMTNSNTPSVKYIFNYKTNNNVRIVKRDGEQSRSTPNFWIHKK